MWRYYKWYVSLIWKYLQRHIERLSWVVSKLKGHNTCEMEFLWCFRDVFTGLYTLLRTTLSLGSGENSVTGSDVFFWVGAVKRDPSNIHKVKKLKGSRKIGVTRPGRAGAAIGFPFCFYDSRFTAYRAAISGAAT